MSHTDHVRPRHRVTVRAHDADPLPYRQPRPAPRRETTRGQAVRAELARTAR